MIASETHLDMSSLLVIVKCHLFLALVHAQFFHLNRERLMKERESEREKRREVQVLIGMRESRGRHRCQVLMGERGEEEC